MKQPEKRKFIRYEAFHLLDYLVLGEDGIAGIYSMGRTIDISMDGIKLESIYPLKADTHLLITLGLDDDLVNFEGKITYSAASDDRFISGVTFLKMPRAGRQVLMQLCDTLKQSPATTFS